MEPAEILSRCKLLIDSDRFHDLRRSVEEQDLNSIFRFVNNDNFDDIRKAMVEQNLHSVFRLLSSDNETYTPVDHQKFEDIRKTVTEKNLHSLFRLFGDENEDFRKLVLDNNHYALIRCLREFTESRLIDVFDMIHKNPQMDPDCMSRSQIRCKQWLVQQVKKHQLDLGTVFLCAGWYGILATMIFESGINVDKIRNFDIDDSCRTIAEKINHPWVIDDWKYKHCTQDIYDINYDTHVYYVKRGNGTECELTDSPDTIINTSCEHIENFDKWYECIPKGKLIILQTNNYFEIKEHVNCVKNIDEFIEQTPMSKRLFQGSLDTPKYTRFMTFGYK